VTIGPLIRQVVEREHGIGQEGNRLISELQGRSEVRPACGVRQWRLDGRNLPEYELIGHGLLEPTAQAFAERVADRYKVRAAIAASTEPG
jgi:hypothetical protein